MPFLPAASLNCWIVWERPVPVEGAASDVTQLDWQRVCGCFADMEETGGLEVQMADQLEARRWWTITIRRRYDLNVTCRGVYRDGRILNITDIADVTQQNVAMKVTAWEGLGVQ